MTQMTTPEIDESNLPTATSLATASKNQHDDNAAFTPIEQTFFTLFGKDGLFGGIAPAMAEVVDALNAAYQIYRLDRHRMWCDHAEQFADRLAALEAGRPDLGLPSTEEDSMTAGDLLSSLEDHSLDAGDLQRVRALLGVFIATALSAHVPLTKAAVERHESLLVCHRNRSRQHEDWRTICSHADIDEGGLRELKLAVKSNAAREFVDEILVALSTAVADPTAVAAQRGALSQAVNETQQVDDEDASEPGYGQPADVEIPSSPPQTSPWAAQAQREIVAPEQPAAETKISLIGWRIVDGLFAPFTRRLGITTSWGASPLADHASVCRSLKHDFLTGDVVARNQVCLGYHSQQCSLPPQLVFTIPLADTGGLYYDVAAGCYWVPYSQVVGSDDASKAASKNRRYGRMRIYIDPDLAAHHREMRERLPDAINMGDLLEAGASAEARAGYLKRYRAYLRKLGGGVHPAYAGRHARSLGPAVKEITGSDILPMFLALDGSMAAAGMLHYVTLTERFVHAQQQRVLARMGWRPPPDLPPSADGVLGAAQALPRDQFLEGWKSLQAACAEAVAALGTATSLDEIKAAWDKLSRIRLLSFGCLIGHRLTRIARLTWQALFGHERYICVSDKVTSNYDAYRLLPVTTRVAQLRACLLNDLDMLRAAIERTTPEALKDAVAHGAPSKVMFFGLKVVARNGQRRLKRTALDLKALEDLSQKHFQREANIGRHQLVSGMVEAGVDHWLIRALTGHFNMNAEAFGDATAIAPVHMLEQARLALEATLSDDGFSPYSSSGSSSRATALTGAVAVPPARSDAYVHPARGVGGRLLPPAADRHSLVALATTDQIRSALLRPDDARDPWVDVLLRISANVTGDFGNVTDLGVGAGLRG